VAASEPRKDWRIRLTFVDFAPTGVYRAERVSVLNTKVLVLNRSYLPIHITVVRRALSLLYQGIARAVDDQYRTFDFASWVDLAADEDSIGLVNRAIRVPRVILLQGYDRIPRRYVRFSRFNIYSRDQNRCQYCGRQFPRAELNLDHVVPRSKGGTSIWENVVCSCHRCNRLKGGRTPVEAGMHLIRQPRRPQWTPFMTETYSLRRYKEWMPFLSAVDAAYWNTELVAE
jgi:5-methylcytosine-specific restriction endonuclease McrA